MTRLGLRPWRDGDDPPPGSVPVTVVVLTRDEEVNIARCLASVGWADQVVVIDSGSTDGTVPLARFARRDVVEQPWLGLLRPAGVRAAAARGQERLDLLRRRRRVGVAAAGGRDSGTAATRPDCAAFAHRLRLVFQGTWIRHCGWYSGSWLVRLVDRRRTRSSTGAWWASAPGVDGPLARLANDIVDEDLKGLASWLHKHVRYAELEQRRRGSPLSAAGADTPFPAHGTRTDTRPLVRVLLKDLVFPLIPAKPLALFLYMYVVRLGLLDGRGGPALLLLPRLVPGGRRTGCRPRPGDCPRSPPAQEANDAHRAA